jgi:hypothetical protein
MRCENKKETRLEEEEEEEEEEEGVEDCLLRCKRP